MSSTPPTYFTITNELADLGAARYDHDTAAIGAKDYALTSHAPVTVQSGRAPRGLENQVFAWNNFQYTTTERDEKEEKKGDLHEGQLHRQNRAAVGGETSVDRGAYGGRGGRGGGMRGGRGGGGHIGRDGGRTGEMDALCAARKPQENVLPLAKGFAEELDKSLFWGDEKIV